MVPELLPKPLQISEQQFHVILSFVGHLTLIFDKAINRVFLEIFMNLVFDFTEISSSLFCCLDCRFIRPFIVQKAISWPLVYRACNLGISNYK